MNKVLMIGRLTRDPETRYGQSGTAVTSFSLAVDRQCKREGAPTADFFNCVTFGKSAEFAEKYLAKGTKIAIEGQMQNNNYKGQDGKTVYRDNIVVDRLEFCEKKADNPTQADPLPNTGGEFAPVPDNIDEELPFA